MNLHGRLQSCVDDVFPAESQELDDCWRINETIGYFLHNELDAPVSVTVYRDMVTLDRERLGSDVRASHSYLMIDGNIVDFATHVFDDEIIEYNPNRVISSPDSWSRDLLNRLRNEFGIDIPDDNDSDDRRGIFS